MSCIFKTQGGGKSVPTASIFVTGLDESNEVKAVQKVSDPAVHRLPDGYTELEYIESTGTQFIDTGVSFDTTEISIEGAFMPLSGAGDVAGITDNSVWGNELYCDGSVVDYHNIGSTTPAQYNVVNTFVSEKQTGTNSRNYYLFAANLTNLSHTTSSAYRSAMCRIYYWKITKNGTLVRNFVPAMRIFDSAVGLYDLATGVFFTNAGSGEFIAGAEIPSYIDGKTRLGVWTQKANPEAHGLPDGYTELAHIESTGTQWIDTGFKPNQDTRVVLDFKSTGSGSDTIKALFGARNQSSADCFDMFVLPTTAYPQYGSVAYNSKPITTDISKRQIYDMNGNVTSVDGVSVEFSKTSFTTSCSLLLFTLNDNNVADDRPVKGDLYSCQIYDNGTLARDFVPAKRNSDGAVGLYDLVSQEFFGNAGTGEFIAGDEIPTYTYGHKISKLDLSYMWTVTATDGEQIATQDVLVDAAVEYEIEMSFAHYLMLFDMGDECEDKTGGWTKLAKGNQKGNQSVEYYGGYESAAASHTTITAQVEGDEVVLKQVSNYTGSLNGLGCMPCMYTETVDFAGYKEVFALTTLYNDGMTIKSTEGGYKASLEVADGCGASVPVSAAKVMIETPAYYDQATHKEALHLNVSDIESGVVIFVGHFHGSASNTMSPYTRSASTKCIALLKEDDWATLCIKAGLTAPSNLATLIADTASIKAILADEDAVKYMVNSCTGDFMASFVASSDCIEALQSSRYADTVFANKHWKKFLDMVGVKQRVYLYREGDECVDVTGGWDGVLTSSTHTVFSYTKNEESMSWASAGNGSYVCHATTSNEIDLGDAKEIVVDFDFSTAVTSYARNWDMSIVFNNDKEGLEEVHIQVWDQLQGATTISGVRTFALPEAAIGTRRSISFRHGFGWSFTANGSGVIRNVYLS